MIVVTAVASNATKAHRENRPPVVAAYRFDRSLDSGPCWAAVVAVIASHPRTSTRLEVNEAGHRSRGPPIREDDVSEPAVARLTTRPPITGGSDERHE